MSVIPVMRSNLSSRGRGKGLFSAGAATKLAFTSQPANVNINVTMSAVVVAIQDANGNTVTSSSATVALALTTGGGTLAGTLSKSATNGVVTFADLSIDTAGLGDRLTATSTGLTQVVSNTFDVTSGSAASFVEDFSEYTSTANMRTNPAGKFTAVLDGSSDGNETNNALQISLDQTGGLNINGFALSQCMLYSFPSINEADYNIGLNMALPSDQDECWVEIYAKFSSDFTTLGPAAGNADYKFNAARTRIAGRYMTFNGTFGTGWQFGTPPPANDQGAGSDVAGLYGNSTADWSPNGSYPFVWDATWHRFRYHLKNAVAGGAVFYIDDFKMPGFPIGTWDTSGGGSIYSWALGRNMNKGTNSTMSVRWGRFGLWFASNNPGWGF